MRLTVRAIEVYPLSVPLIEPFVIATGRIDATRAALVKLTLADSSGRTEIGLGEAAALPPVTREDQPDLIDQLRAAASHMLHASYFAFDDLTAHLDRLFVEQPVSRAAMECAVLDAWARLRDMPLCTLLTGQITRAVVTDITLPIAEPTHMAKLAQGYRARGFHIFKVKIGKSVDDDILALSLIASRVPDARFRLDANAGFSADQALQVLASAQAAGLTVECFEQPCARDDLQGMARVTAMSDVPVIADESVRTLDDLDRVFDANAASGVNLKLVKHGGLLPALRIGERARALDLQIMCGGMVETRLGMTAMGHVVCALGGVDYADLDTAFLLRDDPFTGGYHDEGATLHFAPNPGLGITHTT